jgi:ABC-type transporter Mla subunit MlaD
VSGGVLNFLTPSLGNPLELVFCTVIIGGMLVSLITAEVFGRAPAWERNWQGGTHKGALDIEHGTLGELNQAVATLPERIVANMPGLLLIVGLLGTFLGLGMALDKASGILQGNADSLNAMSDSLGQLTGMMKDLGTKFKTSTWGIIAFIALKLWDSASWSAESRRTGWCVDRMKREIDNSRDQHKNATELRDHLTRQALAAVGEQLVQAIASQSQLLGNELKQLKLIELKRGQTEDEQFAQTAANLDGQLQQLQQLSGPEGYLAALALYAAHLPRLDLLESHGETLHGLDAGLGRLQAQLEQSNQQLTGLGQKLEHGHQLTERLQQTATLQSEHAREDSELRERQGQTLLAALTEQHGAQLDAARAQATHLQERFDELATLSAKGIEATQAVGAHTQASQNSLERFVTASTDNLNALEQAGTTMGKAANQLAQSASALEGSVLTMEKSVGAAIDKLNDDFHVHLQTMQGSLDANISRLSNVMNELQTGMMDNVNRMSQDFTQNTTEMSENLRSATDNISEAVVRLSGEVNEVMASVSRNIEGANKAQTNASAMFTTTNDELNGAISQMEKNMKTLGEQITQGLTDISESNRNMRATGKKLEQLKELPDSFDKLHGHFQELLAQGSQTLLALDKLAGELRSDPHQRGQLLSEAVKSLAELSSQLKTLTASAQQGRQQVANLPQALAEKVAEQFSNHLQPLQQAAGSTVALLQRMADQPQQPLARKPSDEPLIA